MIGHGGTVLSHKRGEEEILHLESGEVLAQATQRSCGCPTLEAFKASPHGFLVSLDLVAGNVAYSRGLEIDGF